MCIEDLTWRRPRDTSMKSKFKSGGHGVPAGEVYVEKHDTATVWCEQEAGRPLELAGSQARLRQGGLRQQMVWRETSPGLAAVV